MGIIRFARRLPHTFYLLALAILLLGGTAKVTAPKDFFAARTCAARYFHNCNQGG
jgi:hypothetical protein